MILLCVWRGGRDDDVAPLRVVALAGTLDYLYFYGVLRTS